MSREQFVSYAQNYEDVVLARAFHPDRESGFWIDVGAGDPVSESLLARSDQDAAEEPVNNASRLQLPMLAYGVALQQPF